eukprot:1149880-Pelagomonas_calceolata.AAC.4
MQKTGNVRLQVKVPCKPRRQCFKPLPALQCLLSLTPSCCSCSSFHGFSGSEAIPAPGPAQTTLLLTYATTALLTRIYAIGNSQPRDDPTLRATVIKNKGEGVGREQEVERVWRRIDYLFLCASELDCT